MEIGGTPYQKKPTLKSQIFVMVDNKYETFWAYIQNINKIVCQICQIQIMFFFKQKW